VCCCCSPCSRCRPGPGRCGGCCTDSRTRRTRGSSCSPLRIKRIAIGRQLLPAPHKASSCSQLHATQPAVRVRARRDSMPPPRCSMLGTPFAQHAQQVLLAARAAARHLGFVLIDRQRFRQLTCTNRMLPLPSSHVVSPPASLLAPRARRASAADSAAPAEEGKANACGEGVRPHARHFFGRTWRLTTLFCSHITLSTGDTQGPPEIPEIHGTLVHRVGAWRVCVEEPAATG
jgi:hypothetical protein